MQFNNYMDLLKKYGKCPHCGSELFGNGKGTLMADDNEFQRTCECGFEVQVKELSDGNLIETYNSELN